MNNRCFPPPWSVEEQSACFVVRDASEPEKRKALNEWATHLKTVIAQATGANVTALRKGDSAVGKRRR
jgi:hypothetical protein